MGFNSMIKRDNAVTLPNEIISMIVSACIPTFDIRVLVSTSETIPDCECGVLLTSCGPGTPMPDLGILKLVSKYFHRQVWTSLCDKFDGNCIIRSYIESGGQPIRAKERLENLFPYLAPRVMVFHQIIDVRFINKLNFDQFPALRRIHFEPLGDLDHAYLNSMFASISRGALKTHMAKTLAGDRDEEILACLKKNIFYRLPELSVLNKLQERGVLLSYRYCSEVRGFGRIAYHIDGTHPKNLFIWKRENLSTFPEDVYLW